ncbi:MULTISPECIES: hypothetical protein [Escherichia]|uniref:hypothetical protein n=1 Tax=Escherichia albertii TaxID=208962 RepID=UPI00124A555B|nr:hypothetical protein [Escherichia albertii]EFA6624495.1 hypothetical protein [Escherichia albertii]EFA7086498.1 hypothetical protein [Escherichia albertii]EFF0833115.1 hypothetical protein [Escherichia albertii]EFF1429756.1 hypothetical protein [Escherichia albertii]EFL5786955.1 hypothetical protein [Escherichia albertii]
MTNEELQTIALSMLDHQREKVYQKCESLLNPWICPYISSHLLSLNPLLACCRRYSRGER